MHHDTSTLYGALHGFGVMLPYLGITVLVYILYLRRARALVAAGRIPRTYALETLLVLAFVPLCTVHRAFITFVGLPPDGMAGLAVLSVLVAASLVSVGVLAWNFKRIDTGLADMTEAPVELKRSRDLLAGVLTSSRDGMMVFDAVRDDRGTIIDFTFEVVNPAAEAIIGRAADSLLGKRLLEELPGNKEEGLFDAYCQVVETGEPYHGSFFYDHDGITAYFVNTATRRGDGFAVTFRDVTEQKNRERALVESQELFRTAFEDAAVGKALLSAEGLPLRVNPSLCAMLGYTEEELCSMAFTEFTHPEDVDIDVEQFMQLTAGDVESYELEKRYLHRDGHIVWGLLSVALQRGVEGELLHIIAEVQDITARRETEEAMRTNAERLQLLLQVTSDTSESLDAQIDKALALTTDVLKLDIGIMSRIKGEDYVVENVYAPGVDLEPGQQFDLGHTYCSLTLASDDVVAIDHMGWSEYKGHPCYEAFGLETYIGLPLYVEGEVYGTLNFSSPDPRRPPFSEEDRNFVRLLGLWVMHAIERRKANNALRTSEERFRNAFRGAVIGKALVNPKGQFIRVNGALCELVGYTEEELLGLTFLDITHPDHIDESKAWIRQMLAGEIETCEIEKQYLHRDGRSVWTHTTVASVTDGDGAVEHFVAEVMDITERKEAERLKNEFVSMVSHELRTPLTSIAGSLRLISTRAAGKTPAPIRKMLDIASRNSERLVRLINDLLDVQKIEAGKLKLDLETKSLNALLTDTLEANQGYGEPRSIVLCLRPSAADLEVCVDPDRFMQIMANLISNAIKFSPDGSTVEISAERRAEAVRVSVRDYGPGVPESFRERLFDRFMQADSSTTRKQEGTGLGLNITQSLVELHGGRLDFETATGDGTTFFFDLPQSTDARSDALNAPGANVSQPALLVVEDDPDVSRVLKMILNRNGFVVNVAESAEHARQLVAERDYAAATLDLRLPDADGIALLREWRTERPDFPVVVLSVEATERQQDLSGGALPVAEWLDKPFQAHELLETIQRVASTQSVPRLLHIEDDPDCVAATALLLSQVGEVVPVGSLAEARAALQHEHFDLAILDLGLPDGDGMDLLPDLLETQTPVTIYSARTTDAEAAQTTIGQFTKNAVDHARLLDAVCSVIEQANPTLH